MVEMLVGKTLTARQFLSTTDAVLSKADMRFSNKSWSVPTKTITSCKSPQHVLLQVTANDGNPAHKQNDPGPKWNAPEL